MRLILSVLLLRAAFGAEQCGDFVCFHNSKCVPGPPDFSNYPVDVEGGPETSTFDEHCECSPQFTGVDCSIPVENCDDGVHHCFHGGICYTPMSGSNSIPYCDCSTAVDLATGKQYVGQYCEQEEADTYCDHVTDLKTFCLNGGTCNNDFPDSSPYPCKCDGTGYKGAHCELPLNLPDCDLQCKNGGICRLGEDNDKTPVESHLSDPGDLPNDHMHCECPQGFYGALCEQKIATTSCGGRFNCLHGAPCGVDDDGELYCACEELYQTAQAEPLLYAGEYCQYPTTESCGQDASGEWYFCTNFGSCADVNDPTAGCICQTGWFGPHCEYNAKYDCTLDCGDHGSCQLTDVKVDRPYEFTTGSQHNHAYQFCDCDAGYEGTNCEVTQANKCGDMAFGCLHGGVCEQQDDGSYACNCLSAQIGDTYYDGKYCQYPSTSVCLVDDDADEVYFCTNMGQCPEDFKDGCHCFAGFGGFSCEFALSDCTLECQNGGTCELGSPPEESYLEAYWFNADDYANWQYCSCPSGYTGKHCEIEPHPTAPVVQCPNGFSCLNGGTCLGTRCDCTDSQRENPDGSTTYFDGLYCQFASTVFCGEDDSDGSVYFCMNNGECDDDWANKACHCPDGFGGFMCELVEGVDCTQDCNNGVCRLGAPPSGSHAHAYWYDPAAVEDYQYCECNAGWGGKYCDVEGEDCGDFTCLNGGRCNDEYGKPMADRCNCLHAWDDGSNGQSSIYYDGRFCQYASTSVCLEDDDQSFFCMNGGQCPDKPGEDPCSCPAGFSGFSCEFIEGTDCTLDCGDDGECRLGTPPGTSHAHAYWFDPDAQGNYQYCECKNGAGGKYCDQKGEDCGSFTCLNGGSCTGPDGKPMVDRCNCLDAMDVGVGGQPNTYYDGRFCQFPSTVVCLESGDESYFCMNNGQCSSNPTKDPCLCEDGFKGFMCEFLEGTDCNLKCGSHGTCRLGAPPGGSHAHAYWYDPNNQENYQYCECDSGWGGKFCEYQGEECSNGKFTCLNGGRCSDSMPDRCDCIEAWDEGEGEIPDVYYEGRFCQYASTSLCGETSTEVFFCVNDGKCGSNNQEGCKCPDGFTGHSCEFIEGTDCTLDCKNGGTCRLGSPPGTDYLHAYWYDADAQDNYQYCECPEGKDGVLCEADTISCGGYQCLNGGKCLTPSGQDIGRCDCNDAYDSVTRTYFDGLFCQFASTSICYESDTDSFFCMNGGICRDDYTLGCDCPEGYGGFYCELQSPQDCTLDCKNGGECVLGSPPGISMADAYWNNEEKSGEYQYCSCPPGYSGELCDKRGGQKCGDSECQNGGTCVTRVIDGQTVNHCDCRTAGDGGNLLFAGTYCQYAATSVCHKDEEGNTAFFCVNNGECKNNYRSGCSCPSGTAGFSCEFVLNNGEQLSCDLDCNGHGTCRNGVKDISDLEDAVNAGHLSYTHDDFKHCVCDDGWTGVYCDHQRTECSGDHFCLHGSECVSGDECDCSTATSSISENFAGDHCEHTADICVKVGDNGSPESYCANGGVCTRTTTQEGASHPGCICPQGFVGEFCEKTINKSNTKAVGDDNALSKSGGSSSSLSGLGITAIVLSVCAVVAVVWFTVNSCVRRKRFTRRRDGETSGLIWASKGGYKDSAETINFAPNKGGYAEDYMASFANPSRDPMATALAPDTTEADAVESDTSTGRLDSDDEPQVFIGPPTDEDGHVLHSVDII